MRQRQLLLAWWPIHSITLLLHQAYRLLIVTIFQDIMNNVEVLYKDLEDIVSMIYI